MLNLIAMTKKKSSSNLAVDSNTDSKSTNDGSDEKTKSSDDGDLKAWLSNTLKAVENNMKSHIDEKYESLFSKIEKNSQLANKAFELATTNDEQIQQQVTELNDTNVNVLKLSKDYEELKKSVEGENWTTRNPPREPNQQKLSQVPHDTWDSWNQRRS